MKKGHLITLVFTDDQLFDFEQITGGKGAMWLTIENLGDAPLIIDDVSQQEILPQESFVVECPVAMINSDFRVKFKEGDKPKAVLRYFLEVSC